MGIWSRSASVPQRFIARLAAMCIIKVNLHTRGNHGQDRQLTRTNLLLETGKVRRLRKIFITQQSEAVAGALIDERMAGVEAGLQALQSAKCLESGERSDARQQEERLPDGRSASVRYWHLHPVPRGENYLCWRGCCESSSAQS